MRAFKLGMAPLVIALLFATGWIIAAGLADSPRPLALWLLTAAAALLVWLTRLHLLWLLAAGAFLGWFGLV
jgi:chromate transporter